MHCPNCGAQNPEGAQWCNQCLTTFRRPVAIVPAPRESSELLETTRAADSGEIKGTWTCPVCDAANPADNTTCSTCDTDLFRYFSPDKRAGSARPRSNKNPFVAMVCSVIPGAGHIYLGRIAEGIGRMVLATWWFGTVFILNAVQPLRWVGTIYLLAGLSLVGVSIVDAYAVGEDETRRPILSRNVIYFSSLGLLGILFMGSMITFMRIR